MKKGAQEMKDTKRRLPAEIFPPGDFIREEIEARGWVQDDLAMILDRPIRTVNEIIVGKRGITPDTAKGLGEAFGTSAQFWLNLESAYRLSLSSTQQESVARRAAIYEIAPIRAMVKRNWIEYSNNMDVLEKRLKDFFGIEKISETPKFWHAARKSTGYSELTPAQNAWLFRARHLATAVSALPFTKTRFNSGLKRLRQLLPNEQDIRMVPKILSESGIRFLIIEPLPQSKIDGACFWVDNSPVIVLSLRYDRIDWFWHTLMHELGHVKNDDGRKNGNIPFDIDLVGESAQPIENRPQYEREADSFAINFLIPQTDFDDFIARVRPLYSKKRIVGFANRINVHPGIVVGQLQHRDEIKYSQNREMLVKIRETIASAALTDGWGYSLPSSI
jgi:HTH-type transcriptional regulator/antitoxin HigA